MVINEKINPKEWVSEYADYLYRYALVRVNEEETAKELVQETFLAALEALPSFKHQSTLQTWLTAILRNKISDEYRRRARLEPLVAGKTETGFFEENGFWKEAYQPKPFGLKTGMALYQKEFDSVLTKCLKKLPALWHSVVSMKFLDEESTRAILQRLEITAANYWVIIHRAKLLASRSSGD